MQMCLDILCNYLNYICLRYIDSKALDLLLQASALDPRFKEIPYLNQSECNRTFDMVTDNAAKHMSDTKVHIHI